MHVLLLAPGHAIHTYRLIRALLESGHRVTLLSKENPIAEKRDNYQYLPNPGIPGFHRLSLGLTARLEFPIRVLQLRRLWRRLRPDMVNIQGLDLRATYCAAAGIRPLVLTCWGADVNDLFDVYWGDEGYRNRLGSMLGASYYATENKEKALDQYKRRISFALRQASLVTAVTPQILRRCEQLTGELLPKQIFRFGVDFDLFRPGYQAEAIALRRQLRIPDRAKVLLSVRTIQPLFGHEDILAAFALLLQAKTIPPTVLVFQEKHYFPQDIDGLRTRARELGVDSHIYWLPSHIVPEQLPVQYAMADVIVNYPRHDGFPVSLLEAAACQRPIVCSEIEAYEGTYGDALIMVPSENVSALADALKRALTEDEADRRSRVEKAYAVARRIGDQQKNFAALFKQLEILAKNRAQAAPRTEAHADYS